MKNKKILIVTTTDDMIYHFVLPYIKELQKMGNVVECACAETGFFLEDIKKKTVAVVHKINFARNPLNPRNFFCYKKLCELVKDSHYDLIFCHQPVGGVFGRKVAHKFGIPVIYMAHGFHFFKGAPLVNRLVYKNIEKYYAKYTDALITINEEDYQSALKFKAKKVYKIHGAGCDFEKFNQGYFNKGDLIKEFGLDVDDFIIIAVGELNKNKNHHVLIDAIKNIDKPNIKLLICGKGPLMQEHQTHIDNNGLSERVKLLGYRKDVSNIMKLSNVFVMPSFREGLPMSMMESMFVGLPVIASNIRGCKDLVDTDKGGFLCDPKSVEEFSKNISTLYNDRSLCDSFGKYNAIKVQDFMIDKVLVELNQIYNDMFGES